MAPINSTLIGHQRVICSLKAVHQRSSAEASHSCRIQLVTQKLLLESGWFPGWASVPGENLLCSRAPVIMTAKSMYFRERAMRSDIEITPPGIEKFTLPTVPVFNGNGPWLSVLSLLGFLIASIVAFVNTAGLAGWSRAPFLFTAIGAGIGFIYELWLIASGRPYQLFVTAGGRMMQWFRALVLVCVFGSVYLVYCLLTPGETGNLFWIVAVSGALTGLLAVALLLRGSTSLAVTLFVLGLAGQLLLVWIAPAVPGGQWTFWLLTAAAIALYASIVAGSETPIQSTIFHMLGIATVAMLYFAIRYAGQDNAFDFGIDPVSVPWVWWLFGFLVAVVMAFYLMPRTWGVLRAFLANATWPLFYLIIAGGLRVPRPERLSVLYKGKEDQLKPLRVMPYYVAHPRNLTHRISVPSLDEALTLKVHAFGFVTRLVTFFFGVASVANRCFPFANIHTPLKYKPRMEPWSDGSHYWPGWLLRRIWLPGLGMFQIQSGVRGPGFQPTPEVALDAWHRGQLLAWLVEYGIAGSFLEPEENGNDVRFRMDFSFLEKYETKPDYESYGGTAWFVIDDDRKCMVLTSVKPPGAGQEIAANPNDASFRRAEDMILASLYYYVVSGKHLVEIHMGLNLVEIALFNAFDAKKHWNHSIRMALYPHLFAHELAEELTTQNLLEDGAVFPQIFATTNAALMQHLNDRFSEYKLGQDEDFELREKVLLTGRKGEKLEDILPRSSLLWELEYASIWQDYAKAIVDATYKNNREVADDECVHVLLGNLNAMFHRPLPERYADLKTRSGLARFIADTMHHLIIRHEVYGTSGVRLSLDPRINKVQVPRDGGTYAIDEWRSLACVAMATSRVRYTKLMINFENVFSDIEDEAIRQEFRRAHTEMKRQLQELEEKYTSDGVDNYQTLRLLPSDLDIGAGY